MKRLALAASLAALSLSASASSASASVAIGQLGPPVAGCLNNLDGLQPTVASGNGYVVPAAGRIISWSHNARAGAGQMLTMKVFRPVAGTTYTAIGHDGPRPLASSTVNTFPASVAVRAGDVLGLHTATGSPGCDFPAPGQTYLYRGGNLADGQAGTFTSDPDVSLNISAMVEPANAFTLGKLKRNKKKGIAVLTVLGVPNPGELVLAGRGLKRRSQPAGAPGDFKLKVMAKGKKKRALSRNGKVRVAPRITFTPTGGEPNTQSRKVKLKKR